MFPCGQLSSFFDLSMPFNHVCYLYDTSIQPASNADNEKCSRIGVDESWAFRYGVLSDDVSVSLWSVVVFL